VVVAALALNGLEQDTAHVLAVGLEVVDDLGHGLLLSLDRLHQVLTGKRELDLYGVNERV
jgi:hypothetical protein